MEALTESDLKEILQEVSDYMQSYKICARHRKEQGSTIALLKESLKASQESENNMRLKWKENQHSISQLQDVTAGLLKIRDENDDLKKEIKELRERLEQEQGKNKANEQKWNEERENILTANRNEIENMKKIRSMEVSSLNREINRIQDEYHQKIDFLRRELEGDCKSTINRYEERLARMSRDLISAQSELMNLRIIHSKDNSNVFNVESKPTKERYIPQPLSLSHLKPLKPIVSTASQLFVKNGNVKSPEVIVNHKEEVPSTPQIKRKKKLYTRTDDLI